MLPSRRSLKTAIFEEWSGSVHGKPQQLNGIIWTRCTSFEQTPSKFELSFL